MTVAVADTSAWVWSRKPGYPELRVAFGERLESGEIATCDMVAAELLCSTRTAAELRARRDELLAMRWYPTGPRVWRRTLDVMEELARRSPLGHRSVKHADLLVAAAAEAAELPVLHYDEDFDRIAAVTGQPVEWLVPKGSLR